MQPFAILGATKTGTSTAAAIANAHPSVFCAYGCDFTQPADDGRNRDLVDFIPDVQPLFKSGESFAGCLRQLNTQLLSRQWGFEWVGTKVSGIRPDLMPKVEGMPVLFMVRDVRVWTVKNLVIAHVLKADRRTNIVPCLISYAVYLLDAFLLERCSRFALDSMLLKEDMGSFPRAVAGLLELPSNPFENWWMTTAVSKNVAPKNYSNWIDGHNSAFLPPIFSDTKSRLNPHPFWDSFLPVFDKYFLHTGKTYPREEVLSDQQHLNELGKRQTMTLHDGFEWFESFRALGFAQSNNGKLSCKCRTNYPRIIGLKKNGPLLHDLCRCLWEAFKRCHFVPASHIAACC